MDLGPPWGVVVCFFLKCNKRIYPSIKNKYFFKEKNGFPEGVSTAVPLCFLSKGFSLLFCETGRITISSGQAVLEGLELVILQKKHGKMLSLFCKKNTLTLTSPVRPLPLCNNKPFIRVRCCCRASDFSFLLNIPVLTKGELKEEPYNVTSNQKCNIFQLDNFYNHLIAFPDDMGMHLPFDGLIGGKLICSLQRQSNPIVQLIFIPDSVRLKSGMHFIRSLKFFNWIDTNVQYSQEQASRNIISIYNIPQVTLSFNFELEATISGLEIKLISTKKTGAWGVLLSRKETGPLSASIPYTGQESNNSPVPGPSSSCPFFVDESAPIESDSEVYLPIDSVTPEGFLQSPAKVFKLEEEPVFLQPTGITSKFFSTKKSGSWRALLSRIETGSLSASIPYTGQESNNSPVPGPSSSCPFFVDESAPIESDSEVYLPIDSVTSEGFLQSPAKVFKLEEEPVFLQPTGITSKFFSTKKSGSWRVLLSRIETGSLSASISHTGQESNNSPVPGPSSSCPFFVDESAPIKSDSEVYLPIDSVTTECVLQSPAKVFKLEEEPVCLQPTGITSKFFSTKKSEPWRVLLSRIETGSLSASISYTGQESNNSPVPGHSSSCPFFVDKSAPIKSDSEVYLPIDPVTTEDSTEVSLPYPVCSMTSIHGMQRDTFSIPYIKSVVFYKKVNSQINAVTLERKKLFLSGQSLLAVLPKQVSFQHGVGFENAQLSVVRENKSSKIFIGFIPINNSKMNQMSHWVIRKWGHPYLSNIKGNLSRIQLVSLRGYLFECPSSATIKMISSTECVLLGMSFVILTDSNSSSPVAFLFAQTDTSFIEVETTAPTGAVTTEDSIEVSLPSPVCSITSIHGVQKATFSIPYTKSVVFYKEVNSHINAVILERKRLFSDGKSFKEVNSQINAMILERKKLFSDGQSLLAVLPKEESFQHGVGFANAQLSIVKEEGSEKIFIGFIQINQTQSYCMSYFTVNRWCHPYLSKVTGKLSRMSLGSLRSYLFECPSSVTVKMISVTECALVGMSVFILTEPKPFFPIALLFAQNESLLSLTEEAWEGSSSNALSTSVHRPQAKRLLPTASKGQAKRKKKNRVEFLMEGALGFDANILQSETDTASEVKDILS